MQVDEGRRGRRFKVLEKITKKVCVFQGVIINFEQPRKGNLKICLISWSEHWSF